MFMQIRKRPYHLLRQVSVESPCTENWNKMDGDEKSRHCNKCSHSVVNLSALTANEAASVIDSAQGRLCVRYFADVQGAPLLAHPNRSHWKVSLAYVVAGALSLVGLLTKAEAFQSSVKCGPSTYQSHQNGQPKHLTGKLKIVKRPSATPTMGIIAIPTKPNHSPSKDSISKPSGKKEKKPTPKN